jgi:uncharacterized membrane protein
MEEEKRYLKIKTIYVLLSANILSVAVTALSLYTTGPLRIILGLPFVLFVPGYTLMMALFPEKKNLDSVERFALSIGMSIAVVPLLGLILNYTPWGIRLAPVICAISIFTLSMSVIAWFRTRRLPGYEIKLPKVKLNSSKGPWDIALTAVLIVCLIGAGGAIWYTVTKPKAGDFFTEFYLLGPDGKLENYPRQIASGDIAAVKVGIVNHEGQTLPYRVQLLIDGVKNQEIGPVMLTNQEKWEQDVTFKPVAVRDNQKVEFVLLKGDETQPSLNPLHIWIDVKAQGITASTEK